jgi:hypothetical protein
MTTRTTFVLAGLAACLSLASGSQERANGNPDWPAITREAKPWTRWWWMGSAVDAGGLTADLEALAAAGLGGVEITPIYGAAGSESRFVPYLSAAWVRLLEHSLAEAARLGIGVDMATGTGWPFGGPWVGDRDSARTFGHRTWTLEGGQRLTEPVRLEQAPMLRAVGTTIHEVIETPGGRPAQSTRDQPIARPGARRIQIFDIREPVEANTNLQALALEQVRYQKPLPLVALVALRGQTGVRPGSDRGQTTTVEDLTARVKPDGTLDWTAPPGSWVLHGVFLGWHGKLVERAAPGGEGNVIDHFSRDAIRNYLGHFDRAFAGRPLKGLRAFFNDSYEVDDASGQADATASFFEEFQRRRGYDLRRHLATLFGSESGDTGPRVIADYRETISDLLLDTFTTEWRAWAKGKGAIVRNQAHGSPANILDLYAASDVPETEGAEISRFKWATSAAHVAGRRLVSAEAATWLGEHFRGTLADVRAAVDQFFIAGVNHIVYHGTAYSPPQQPWPGWQFYASVEFNPRNSWWNDFAALNGYVTRAQSFLQAGRPDHDVLVYYPFYDSLAVRGKELLKHYGGANPPPEGTTFESATDILQKRGYTYDFVSDRQLANTRATGAVITTGGGSAYRVLVLPASKFIPVDTFERILLLARNGATVVAFKGLPADVSGLADLDRRRARFEQVRNQIRFGQSDASGIREARLGRGKILTGDDLASLLERARVQRETLVDLGLAFTRRQHDGGRYYFLVNTSDRDVDNWIPLNDRGPSAVVFDPMNGQKHAARVRRASAEQLEVELKLPRASSLVIATTDVPGSAPAPVLDTAGTSVAVKGPWTVRFASGGPALPTSRTLEQLASWTTFGGDDVQRFSGTAVYSTTFPRPSAAADAFELDLGQVRESARVELNGRSLGTLIGPSFKMTIDRTELAPTNTLTVAVSNLMANRIAALDKAGVVWRNFYNVNFPARLPQNRGADGLFNAASWAPLDSGLLGPVTLMPLSPRK